MDEKVILIGYTSAEKVIYKSRFVLIAFNQNFQNN